MNIFNYRQMHFNIIFFNGHYFRGQLLTSSFTKWTPPYLLSTVKYQASINEQNTAIECSDFESFWLLDAPLNIIDYIVTYRSHRLLRWRCCHRFPFPVRRNAVLMPSPQKKFTLGIISGLHSFWNYAYSFLWQVNKNLMISFIFSYLYQTKKWSTILYWKLMRSQKYHFPHCHKANFAWYVELIADIIFAI